MKLVIHNKGRVWGGNEKWLATLAAGLVRRGHRVVVSCPPDGPVSAELVRRGIPISAVRPGGLADLPGALRFAKWLEAEKPDALLLTSWNRTVPGAWAGKRAGVPRVVVRLGIVRTLRGRFFERVAFRRWVDRIIVNSADIRVAWLGDAPWFSADAVRVVLNGVEPFKVDSTGRAGLREELGLPAGAVLVAGVGHLSHRKGFDVLVDAFARAAVPNAELLLVGDGEEGSALAARADTLGLRERVHFLGRRADGARIIAGSDIFVLSSRNEGMANVMLEAMASGVPVIATAVSGVREALAATASRPPAGWIVPPDDSAALADALGHVAADLRGAQALVGPAVAEAEARGREWFGVERMVDEAERVLFS